MRVAVVGGKLQGVEASYLAKKAGWEVVLIDKKTSVPAIGLCDTFYNVDVSRVMEFMSIVKNVDFILPALENIEALDTIARVANYSKVPVVYDAEAYLISSSKLKSNDLFARLGVPAPSAWPTCNFPVIAKPSGASGSQGVVRINNREDLLNFTDNVRLVSNWIVEEYVEGPSYSIEVLGYKGNYKVLQITELQMDAVYDCKRVLAPVNIEDSLKKEFENIGLVIARSLNLNGIMDVEVILHNGTLKVLEIDARLPSQTPTAVFKSTGINMVELLGKTFTEDKMLDNLIINENTGVIYQHIKVSPERIEVSGEHIMSEANRLNLLENFFGATEAITEYALGKKHWVATLIIEGRNREHAWKKRCEVIRRIAMELDIKDYRDSFPVPLNSGDLNLNYGGSYDEIA